MKEIKFSSSFKSFPISPLPCNIIAFIHIISQITQHALMEKGWKGLVKFRLFVRLWPTEFSGNLRKAE